MIKPEKPQLSCLTSREKEVLDLISKGNTNKQIAQVFRISLSTVNNHVHALIVKLQVSTRTEAARLYWTGEYADRQD